MLRRRVLRAVLEAEREGRSSGESARSGLVPANYEFTVSPPAVVGDTLVRVEMRPRRSHAMLLDGAMYIDPATADLVRVEGRVTRRPSFWTRRVDVVRHYGRVAGVRVPTATESTAQVLLAGLSSFSMTYTYESVNGRAVPALDAQP
jgi:hypothetical protein